jgi:hypothetical protein
MDTGISGFPRGDLRVSDAERDRAVAALSENYQSGRLTLEEFEDRSGRALQARTGDELSSLFTDLPRATVPAASPAGPGFASERWMHRVPVGRVVLLCVLVATIVGNVVGNVFGNSGNGHGFTVAIPVIVLAIIFRRRLFGRR